MPNFRSCDNNNNNKMDSKNKKTFLYLSSLDNININENKRTQIKMKLKNLLEIILSFMFVVVEELLAYSCPGNDDKINSCKLGLLLVI